MSNKSNEPSCCLEFFYQTVNEAGLLVREGKRNLWTIIAENPDADDACYLHFYNAADLLDVTVGTTTPVWSVRLHAGSTIQLDRGEFALKHFPLGIVVAVTLAITGSAAPTSDPQITLHYQ